MRARTWAAKAVGAALLVCVASVGASAQMGPAKPAPAPLIVPGRSLGQWTLDTVIQDLLFQFNSQYPINLSEPTVQFRKGLWYHEWHEEQLTALSLNGSPVVAALGTSDPSYRTAEHIGVGSSPQQITAAYNNPDITLVPAISAEVLIYNSLGIAFELPYVATANGYPTVERVFVFRAGQAASIWVTP